MSSNKDMQILLLEMLESIITIFNEHNIKYYLSGGSVLGAVRHNGFIPWDDDIDIMVLRKDYDKLQNLFDKELGNDLIFQNYKNCDDYPYIFSRIMMIDTALVFKGVEHLDFHHGIHIDIQPIDKVPMNSLGVLLAIKIKFYKTIYNIINIDKCKKRNIAKKVLILLIQTFIKKKDMYRIIIRNMRKYEEKEVDGIVCFGGIYGIKEIFNNTILGDGIKYNFESNKYIIPENYDKYLSQLYGDYMKIPHKKYRYNHHNIFYFSLDKEYVLKNKR